MRNIGMKNCISKKTIPLPLMIDQVSIENIFPLDLGIIERGKRDETGNSNDDIGDDWHGAKVTKNWLLAAGCWLIPTKRKLYRHNIILN